MCQNSETISKAFFTQDGCPIARTASEELSYHRQIQKINYELARNSGRMAKRPWPINVAEKLDN
jgi:hypothetical protein